jgi:hypothetical protein
VPEGYGGLFKDLDEPDATERHKIFLLKLADGASATLIEDLISQVDSVLSTPGTPKWQPQAHKEAFSKKVQEIYADLENVAPAQNAGSVAHILIAAWRAYRTGSFWSNVPQIQRKVDPTAFREKTLKEIVLKSIEVFEFEEITKAKQ